MSADLNEAPRRASVSGHVYSGYVDPVPAGNAYAVKIWDPANGEFTGSGLEVLHVDVVSFFSN